MAMDFWQLCLTTTNAVERKNAQCKESRPLPIKLALANLYRLDKAVCFKHIASLKGTSLTYQSKSAASRSSEAAHRSKERSKQWHDDTDAQHGPTDRKCNFKGKAPLKDSTNTTGRDEKGTTNDNGVVLNLPLPAKRWCVCHNEITDPDMGILGKKIEMEFEDEGTSTWWIGSVTEYDPKKNQYTAFFSSDNTTVYFNADDKDYRILH